MQTDPFTYIVGFNLLLNGCLCGSNIFSVYRNFGLNL